MWTNINSYKKRKWLTILLCGGLIFILLIFFQLELIKTHYHAFNMRRSGRFFNSTPMPEAHQLDEISKILPNLPIHFWKAHEYKIPEMFYKNASCAPFPFIFNLHFNNFYWQQLKTKNGSFSFYSAFYDTRGLTENNNSVRVISMIEFPPEKMTVFCHLWFENQTEPMIVETQDFSWIWIKEWGGHWQGLYSPYIITCQLPKDHGSTPPVAISIVEHPCDSARNLLRVTYDPPPVVKDFGVCVKGLDFLEQDLSARLVEWFELMDILGADKVYLYHLQVHPNMKKVLDYYENRGKIDVKPVTLPDGQPNIPFLQHLYIINNNYQQCLDELIPYNDCFYRNIYNYRYVVVIDIDEVIVPIRDNNWKDLMNRVLPIAQKDGQRFASFNARNVYFLDDLNPNGSYTDIPPYLHILQHVYRSRNFTDPYNYVKSFFDTQTVIAVHNHLPMINSPKVVNSFELPLEDAHMHHYRKDCPGEVNCNDFRPNPVLDTTIWRFKDDLMKRSNIALKEIGLI